MIHDDQSTSQENNPLSEHERESMTSLPQDNGDTLTILLQGQIAALEAQIKSATSELEEWKDKALRAQAEFQNARTRYEKEKSELIIFGSERIMRELLPSMDTFAQAFAHLPEELKTHQWVQGIIQCEKMFQKALEQGGLKKIDITLKKTHFDPNHHEAIAQDQVAIVEEKGTILEVYQEGYLLGEKVLRPAKVKVGA